MKQNNIVRKNEFDRYLIPLPLTKLIGKQKKKFIYSELEKRHPCFSNDFCFDSQLRINRKGLCSDVVVMNKGKYCSYKKWNGIVLEGCKSKRFKSDFLFSGLVIFLLAFSILTGFFLGRKFRKINNPVEETSPGGEETEKLSDEMESFENLLPSAGSLAEDFFEIIQSENGKISSFTWEIKNGIEKISSSLNSMTPESLFSFRQEENFNLSSLSYVNGGEKFSFSCGRKIKTDSDSHGFIKTIGDENVFEKEIRLLLQESGCEIFEEKFFPYVIKFKTGDTKVFISIKDFLEASFYVVEKMSFEKNDESNFMVEIAFAQKEMARQGVNVDLIDIYSRLFLSAKKSPEKKSSLTAANKEERLLKIGQVNYSDGKKLVFYKDEKGKILKKMESD